MAQDRPATLVTESGSRIGRAGYDVAIDYSRSREPVRRTLGELGSPFVTAGTIAIDGGCAATS